MAVATRVVFKIIGLASVVCAAALITTCIFILVTMFQALRTAAPSSTPEPKDKRCLDKGSVMALCGIPPAMFQLLIAAVSFHAKHPANLLGTMGGIWIGANVLNIVVLLALALVSRLVPGVECSLALVAHSSAWALLLYVLTMHAALNAGFILICTYVWTTHRNTDPASA